MSIRYPKHTPDPADLTPDVLERASRYTLVQAKHTGAKRIHLDSWTSEVERAIGREAVTHS